MKNIIIPTNGVARNGRPLIKTNQTKQGYDSEANMEQQNYDDTYNKKKEGKTCEISMNKVELGPRDVQLFFLATIIIPAGFVMAGDNYRTSLVLDAQNLSSVGMTQIYECNKNENCKATKTCALLNGKLVYNVTIENFKAMCPLESANVAAMTSFQDFGDIYIDKILSCTYDEQTNVMSEYTIIPTRFEEFITMMNGQSVFRKRNSEEYNALLRNPEIQKVLNIPYRLMICIKKDEESNVERKEEMI